MAVSRPFRCRTYLMLNDLDREIFAERAIVLAQYPDEPDEHVLLRFLAHVFFYDDHLEDAPGWIENGEPDACVRALTGEMQVWIECGPPPIKRLTKALGRHKDARFVCFFSDEDEARVSMDEIAKAKPRNLHQLEVHLVDAAMMARLEDVGSRSMTWSATITEGRVWLDCDGEMVEGALQRLR